ncbi:MAG: adenosylcobinamide-phosphate synthase CbiB [Roseiflexaceae bacterium]
MADTQHATRNTQHATLRRLALPAALLIDRLLGEPPDALHPVAWLGQLIGALERRAPRDRPLVELGYGAGVAALACGAAIAPAIMVERLLKRHWLGMPLSAGLLKATFAWQALTRAGASVRIALEAEQLDDARQALRALVSRGTAGLDVALLAAAAIESLAENASDSFVAPLLYYQLLGLPGACAYRAANTLDAMLGYRGRYEYLGKLPARLDDALNLAPARLTALLIVGAAALGGGDAWGAWAAMRRDHGCTASPNAGYPMSAIAGALGVRLEKVGHYCLNPSGRPPGAADIRAAERIVSLALGIAAAIGIVLQGRRGDKVTR